VDKGPDVIGPLMVIAHSPWKFGDRGILTTVSVAAAPSED
jgi:hypothetical protein